MEIRPSSCLEGTRKVLATRVAYTAKCVFFVLDELFPMGYLNELQLYPGDYFQHPPVGHQPELSSSVSLGFKSGVLTTPQPNFMGLVFYRTQTSLNSVDVSLYEIFPELSIDYFSIFMHACILLVVIVCSSRKLFTRRGIISKSPQNH